MPSSDPNTSTQTILSPGRVNLLGEHVDYNDGPVLPVAIDLTLTLEFSPLDSDEIILHALDLGKTAHFSLANLDQKVDLEGQPLPRFALYPAGVAWACQQTGLPMRGLEASYTSNIPIGSGLSSSAAVEVAFAQAFKSLGNWDIDRMSLVKLTKQAENDYVGVQSGIMDQFAVLFGQKDHALYLDTATLAWEAVPLPPDVAIIVADSQEPRELAGSAYNDRRSACQQAVSALQHHLPRIKSLREVSPEAFHQYSRDLPEKIRMRGQHVVEEIARVEESVKLLKTGDVTGFGKLMIQGHESLRDTYEVSTPELNALVEIALAQPGCYGARLTGAGFGGCTVNLVRDDQAESFISNVASQYHARMGKSTRLYHCHASQGAHLI
ncbi:MAG: galactokinase [Anaerolineaceae bacterium]|nr:galactokinase [Anaerolineaceae bacterium]